MNSPSVIVKDISKIFRTSRTDSWKTVIKCFLRNGWRVNLKKAISSDNSFTALSEINFTVSKGQSVGIIGHNGSGKTTLLKILSGITEPTTGTVEIFGDATLILDAASGFVPDLTGKENIYIYGQLLGLSKKEISSRTDEIIKFSELSDFLEQPLKHYSSGMIMRLAFSVFIHQNKAIFLFDEVFSIGDSAFRNKCFEKMNELKNDKKTFIIVSHNLNEISTICDTIILLESGRIIMQGNAHQTIKYYNLHTLEKNFLNKLERKINELNQKFNDYELLLSPKVQWENITDAPGNESIRLLEVAVTSGNKQSPDNITTVDQIFFDIKYQQIGDASQNNIAISLSDIMDNRLFGDITNWHYNQNDKFYMKPAGIYSLKWMLPSNILNDGIFKLSITIFNSINIPVYRKMNVITFEIKKVNINIEDSMMYCSIQPQLKLEWLQLNN